jgi:MFS family permease
MANDRPTVTAPVQPPAPAARDPLPGLGEWRTNWRIVLVSTVGVGMGGIHIYSLGTFIIPLSTAFGWSRAQITSGLSIVSLFSVIFSAFVGLLIDRVGPRRIAIPGVLAFCSAVALLSTTGSSIWNWWLLWILVAASIQLAKATVWTTAIATRFARNRGFAIALVLSGAGISTALTPPYVAFLVLSD